MLPRNLPLKNHFFSGSGGSGINSDGSCHMDDPHCSEMEAIQSLHKKLDDDANGNIDISESSDVSVFDVELILENLI